ncbi:DUF1449 domain-containing protein [Streptomyces sp. JJ36]|uniref:DUF1449 domain-containing protein n=1 Tax=Streptomyces sp. JJ36 TaxID=2736645 RepID=UPI001F1C070C|nr:DUF1449 domain-containing protein [Streptomyces sp. JJ36]MCF6523760.1 DUF1449 domain-containing protein [Streptomyces sp. JJ36]
MSEFLRLTLDFPAVLFSSALLVVVIYWLFVLVGGVDVDAPDGGGGIGSAASGRVTAGALAGFGLGGAPVAVAISLLVPIAWFLSLASAVLLPHPLLRLAALPLVLAAAWAATRGLLRPLRRLFRPEEGISHHDFVGLRCVVRTGHVGPGFGQAEVTAPDGSTALVQVRAEAGPPDGTGGGDAPAAAPGLTAGRTALIFDYDDTGGFFRIAPWDDGPGPDPGGGPHRNPPLR